jgi:hypothetical protein
MKFDNDVNTYTAVVLSEAKQQLELQGTTTDLIVRLAHVADMLKLLTAYKVLGTNIKTFLEKKRGNSCREDVEEYASTIRMLLQRDISSLKLASDNVQLL